MLTQNLPEYWENLYQTGQDKWSLNKPTPPLLDFLSHAHCPKEGRVLVPGAGRGHDSAEWAKRGYETIAVDFAQTAFESLCEFAEMKPKLSVLKLDLFDLTPKSTESFDIVYEYTCFSSIHPGRRDEYFEIWHKMLKPDGVVIALFYPLISNTNLEGPPHPTSEGELMARLDGVFKIVEKIPAKNSVKERMDQEEFWIL
ncbi:methyltransferase domain-containing protein, partial [Fibrobacterota bacterium]